MSNPLLDSLEIGGYRCFEKLTIDKLGQVNLIAGKNNVGKTALLEALLVYAQRGAMFTLVEILARRDEVPVQQLFSDQTIKKEPLISGLSNLFHNRPALDINSKARFLIESNKNPLCVYFTQLLDSDGKPTVNDEFLKKMWGVSTSGLILASSLYKQNIEQLAEFYSLENGISMLIEPPPKKIPSGFIRPHIMDNDSLAATWDNALQAGLEEKALRFLQVIEPELRFISFISTLEGNGRRYPIASSGGASKRVALKSYGEGMTRLLGLSLALVQSQNGILLIDEIESGLHYSVLPDIWKLLFHTAKELNVQVFATTHSKDCIEAFAAASHEYKGEGMFIRLQRQGETIVAKSIEEERLALAVDYDVEVR